jgi:hypothetical protein
MPAWLKTHPFAVEAFFEHSLVLTFAVPRAELQALLPAPLLVDSFDDDWGFVAVALVQTRHLRPQGFPRWLGQDFFLLGYRAFVRYHTAAGKRLRGLYILRSETEQRRMAWAGNIFTHYNYHTVDIQQQLTAETLRVQSQQAGLRVEVQLPTTGAAVPLPPQSPFADWAAARRFAGPLPFTFSVEGNQVIIIEGVREHWQPQPVAVTEAQVGFFKQLPFSTRLLANAFLVRDIPYAWKKGRSETWQH